MKNQIVKHEEMSLGEILQSAKIVADSGLFKAWNTIEKVSTLMLIARSEGIDPISAMNRYDLVSGHITKRSQAMLSDFLIAGGKVEWLESTDKIAKGKFTTPAGVVHIETFTWEDAVRAKIAGKDNYKNYPCPMLRHRCVTFALRAVYPAVTNLMLESSEAADMPVINVTPSAERPQIEGATLAERIVNKVKAKPVETVEQKKAEPEKISREQQKKLFAILTEYSIKPQKLKELLLSKLKIDSSSDIKKDQFDTVLGYIDDIVQEKKKEIQKQQAVQPTDSDDMFAE